jgi:hypothetical protein
MEKPKTHFQNEQYEKRVLFVKSRLKTWLSTFYSKDEADELVDGAKITYEGGVGNGIGYDTVWVVELTNGQTERLKLVTRIEHDLVKA